MEPKKILPIGAFIAIAVAVAVSLGMFSDRESKPTPSTQLEHYSAQGLSFDYAKTYTLTSRSDSFENSPIVVLTILPKDVVIPDMSEGPPGISVLAVPNPQNIPLEEWVRTKSISNIQLSMDLSLGSTTVGGQDAVTYKFPGLYENDAVAVAHKGSVYLFFGSWADANGSIRTDFQNLLKTVTFK